MAGLVDMCASGWLRPGVLLLSGESDAQKTAEVAAVELAMARRSGRVKTTRVRIGGQEDSDKISGGSGSIRGGLMRAIDDVTNRNGREAGEEGDMLVAVCEASETGLFMLRELLEEGESRTHRQVDTILQ
jgi:hypothetical protein